MIDDPYEILGVPRSAGAEEIRRAYMRRAKQLHPDATGSDSGDEMKLLNLAYEILGDQARRARYDAESATGSLEHDFDDLEVVVQMWKEESDLAGGLPQYKVAALNRELVRMENEGWTVERLHDHLVCERTERRGGVFGKRVRRRVTISIDRDGRPHQVEQIRPD